jgi:hypothetical protein
LVWDFDSDDAHERERGEPDALVLKGINATTRRSQSGTSPASAISRTTVHHPASWIYCGVFPAPDRNLAARAA